MKAAFLIRCSTKKQDYERQVKDLTRLAIRFGYEYGESTIYGEHITGKDDASKKDRASIQHLKEDANKGVFDVVLVSEVSRMSRDPMSGRLYVRQLINMEIPVYFRDIDTWTIDPETGKKTRDAETIIGGAFDAAWKYLKSMKTQIASGRRDELDNNCMSIGQPYFGYTRFGGRDKTTKNKWIIKETESKVVVEIFNEYLKEGATLKSVALAMTNKWGAELNRRFSISSIEHILTYEPYATGIKVVNLTDPDTGEVDKFNVEIPSIISKGVFEKAALKRVENRKSGEPYPTQKTYMLSKLIKCPHCEHTMTPRKKSGLNNEIRLQNGKPAVAWCCMSGVNNATTCKNRITISNEKLESVIWGLVKKELIGLYNEERADRDEKIEEIKERIKNINADLENYKVQIETMKKQMERAYKAYIEAPDAVVEMAKENYLDSLKKCEDEKSICENKIEGLNYDKERFTLYLKSLEQPELPETIIKRAEENPTEKRRLVKELIEKIYPYKIDGYV
jgi:DNA invertase Pin-like site-specific DNA recombinase